jgi:hypothetical protein
MSAVGWLQICSAVCAFLAALFWFLSAASKPPEMTFEDIDNLTSWLRQSAEYNQWAACFAGASAVFAAVATLFGIA